MKRVIGWDEMKLRFWNLKVRAAIGNKGISPHGMHNKTDQPTKSGYFSHLNPFISSEVRNSRKVSMT
jgi:hypothetical protein